MTAITSSATSQLEILAKNKDDTLVIAKTKNGLQLKSVGKFEYALACFLSFMGVCYVTNKKFIEAKVIHFLMENETEFNSGNLKDITNLKNKVFGLSEQKEHPLLDTIVQTIDLVTKSGQKALQQQGQHYEMFQEFLKTNQTHLVKFESITKEWEQSIAAKTAHVAPEAIDMTFKEIASEETPGSFTEQPRQHSFRVITSTADEDKADQTPAENNGRKTDENVSVSISLIPNVETAPSKRTVTEKDGVLSDKQAENERKVSRKLKEKTRISWRTLGSVALSIFALYYTIGKAFSSVNSHRGVMEYSGNMTVPPVNLPTAYPDFPKITDITGQVNLLTSSLNSTNASVVELAVNASNDVTMDFGNIIVPPSTTEYSASLTLAITDPGIDNSTVDSIDERTNEDSIGNRQGTANPTESQTSPTTNEQNTALLGELQAATPPEQPASEPEKSKNDSIWIYIAALVAGVVLGRVKFDPNIRQKKVGLINKIGPVPVPVQSPKNEFDPTLFVCNSVYDDPKIYISKFEGLLTKKANYLLLRPGGRILESFNNEALKKCAALHNANGLPIIILCLQYAHPNAEIGSVDEHPLQLEDGKNTVSGSFGGLNHHFYHIATFSYLNGLNNGNAQPFDKNPISGTISKMNDKIEEYTKAKKIEVAEKSETAPPPASVPNAVDSKEENTNKVIEEAGSSTPLPPSEPPPKSDYLRLK